MNDKKIAYCFDLDGTLTSTEILPIIAKHVGLYQEIEALTTATIQGVIPFDASFKLRCKLLQGIDINKIHQSLSSIKFYDKLKKFIIEHNHDCFIITGNLNIWIEPILREFKCKCYTSVATFKDENKLFFDIDTILQKNNAIVDIRKTHDKIVSVGDGMGDVCMFNESDVRIAFGGTHPPIDSLIKTCDYVINDETSLINLLKTIN